MTIIDKNMIEEAIKQAEQTGANNAWHSLDRVLKKAVIETALIHTAGNQSAAAKILGINRATFRTWKDKDGALMDYVKLSKLTTPQKKKVWHRLAEAERDCIREALTLFDKYKPEPLMDKERLSKLLKN